MRNRSASILIGNYPPPITGQSVAFKVIVDEFRKRNIPFHVLNTSEGNNNRTKVERFRVYVKVIIILFKLLSSRKYCNVYHIISSSKFGFFRDLIIISLAKIFRTKVIIHSHNGNYNEFYQGSDFFFKLLIKITINRVDTIILLSKSLEYTFSFINDKEKFEFIPNTLPQTINNRSNRKKNLEINILYLSNLIESKGYLDLIDAAIILKNKGLIDNYQFHFAGQFIINPSQDLSYKTLSDAINLFFSKIHENHITENVTYHGVVSGEEKNKLFQNADCFILPTYYNVEAQPITIIEALAFGLPIFSTDYRGISEMINLGFNGVFLKEKNPDDIAEKLINHTKDELLIMGDNSKILYEKTFNHSKKMKILFSLFNQK